jgi:hypothetical protein
MKAVDGVYPYKNIFDAMFKVEDHFIFRQLLEKEFKDCGWVSPLTISESPPM